MTNRAEFSPIITEAAFQEAINYIATNGLALAKKILGEERPIDTITFFTHSQAENEFLRNRVKQYGPVSIVSHGETLYIDSNFKIVGHTIKYFGVRAPDKNRTEAGYVDYPVDDYDEILAANHDGIQEVISGRGQKLLELRHPDFDVRGYIVNAADH